MDRDPKTGRFVPEPRLDHVMRRADEASQRLASALESGDRRELIAAGRAARRALGELEAMLDES